MGNLEEKIVENFLVNPINFRNFQPGFTVRLQPSKRSIKSLITNPHLPELQKKNPLKLMPNFLNHLISHYKIQFDEVQKISITML